MPGRIDHLTISIREAAAADWEAVADVTQSANQQYAATADPGFWINYENSTRQMLLTETEILRIGAYENGELIASVIYCPPYEREMPGRLCAIHILKCACCPFFQSTETRGWRQS